MPSRVKDKANREKQAYDFFIQKGLTPIQSAALVGNFIVESGLNTRIEGDRELSTPSVGIAQWRESRLATLRKKYNDPYSFENQLDFVWWELNNTEKEAFDYIKQAETPETAAIAVRQKYERAWAAHDDRRIKFTTDVLNRYSSEEEQGLKHATPQISERGQGQQTIDGTSTQTVNQNLINLQNTKENINFAFPFPVYEDDEEEEKDPDSKEVSQAKQILNKRKATRDYLTQIVAQNLAYEPVEYVRTNPYQGQPPQMEDGGKVKVIDKDGNEQQMDRGSKEYKEHYNEGDLVLQTGEEDYSTSLPAVELSSRDKQYPYYNTLSDAEREYFNDESPIGRAIRGKAVSGRTVNADDVLAMPGQLLSGAGEALQASQAGLVEGVEYLRGNEYDFERIMPSLTDSNKQQRVPTDVWGIENDYHVPIPELFKSTLPFGHLLPDDINLKTVGNFAMDAFADPSLVTGVGAVGRNVVKRGVANKLARKATQEGTSSPSIIPKITNELNKIGGSLNEGIQGTQDVLRQAIGELKNGRVNRKAIEEGNEWLRKWIDNPHTQRRIDEDMIAKMDLNPDDYSLGLIREQSKKFKPNSKEYSLLKQLDENIQQYFGSTKPNIHKGNYGVSYAHSTSPTHRAIIDATGEVPFEKHGSWISRQTNLPTSKRVNTTIHEGTHDWVSAEAFKKSGMRDKVLEVINPNIKEDLVKWENLRKVGKNPENEMGSKAAHRAYLAAPTEVHARVMELRKLFKIEPGRNVTPEDSKFIIDWMTTKGRKHLDPGFFDVIDKDPQKLSKLFNNLWAAPAAVATGAATQMEDGGKVNTEEGDKGTEESTNINYVDRTFNNIVEKQNYWDELENRYGKHIKGRQNFLDDLNKRLPPINIKTFPMIRDSDNSLITAKKLMEGNTKGFTTPEDFERGLKLLSEDSIQSQQKESSLKEIIDNRKIDSNTKAFLAASVLAEGGDKFVDYVSDQDELYLPDHLDGYKYFGLDTIYDRAEEFIKKGYLDKDFKKRVVKNPIINEKGEEHNSAYFTNYNDIIDAKLAFYKDANSKINNLSKKEGIKLSDKAKDFFIQASFITGDGNTRKMLLSFKEKGYLENDKFLDKDFEPESWKDPYNYTMRKAQAAQMIQDEGFFN